MERNIYRTENSWTEIMQHFFNLEYYTPSIENLAFNFPRPYILGGDHCAGKRYDIFVSWHNKSDQNFTRDYSEIYQVLSEQVPSQYLYGCESIYMEGFVLEHFNKLKPSTIPMAQLHYSISDESNQYSITISTHLRILLQFILTKEFISPFLQPCGIIRMVVQSSIFVHILFIYHRIFLYNFILLLTYQ